MLSLMACFHRAESMVVSEMAAVRTMAEIARAEKDLHHRSGRYASWSEWEGLHGYRFSVDVRGSGFTVRAEPVRYSVTGRRSFFLDESGAFHETWENRPARAGDRLVL